MNRAIALGLALAVLLAIWWSLREPAPSPQDSVAPQPVSRDAAAGEGATAAGEPETAEAMATQAVSDRGIALRITQRPPLHDPPPPYGAVYRELLPLAEAGEATAQYRLGMALQQCRDVPEDAAALAVEIERMHQTREHDGWPVDDPATQEQLMRAAYAHCEGIPQAAREDARSWIKAAADAGLLEAQLRLMFVLPKSDYCQFLWQCSPQQRAFQEQLQQEALQYLERARAAGSAEALWTFGHWYTSEEVLPRDDVEAYAHFRALDQIMAAAGAQRRHLRMIESLRAQLRPVDLERAEARADELLSNPRCCIVTP